MEENTQQQGSYKVENIFLIESNFYRNPVIDFKAEIENKLHLTTEIEGASSDQQANIVVSVILTLAAMQGEEKVYSINIKMTGIFVKEGAPKLPEDTFKRINAPAIIYPFIREQVATTCLKAGLGSVVLPPVNFVERGKEGN